MDGAAADHLQAPAANGLLRLQPIPWWLGWLVFASLYTGIAGLSLTLAAPGSSASPFWPPAGLAAAWLLLFGQRAWPAITVGALAANLIHFSAFGPLESAQIWAAGWIALGNTLEAVIAALAIARIRRFSNSDFHAPTSVFNFFLSCGMASGIGASAGGLSLWATGLVSAPDVISVWTSWWIGDVTGLVVLVPMLLAWSRLNELRWSWNYLLEAAAVGAVLWLVMVDPLDLDAIGRPVLLLVPPYLAWVIWRSGVRGGTLGILSLALIGAYGTTVEGGPWALGTFGQAQVQLSVFLCLQMVIVLLLGADRRRRKQASLQLELRQAALPWGLLILGSVLTLLVWQMQVNKQEQEALRRFDNMAQRLDIGLEDRVGDYQAFIKGGASLFIGRSAVTRQMWHDYVASLSLSHTLPGIQGLGFAQLIPPGELERHISQVQAEGFPAYVVKPPGSREVYTSIVYLEPFDARNQRAFGFDMFSEATRRQAMEVARDSGRISTSAKVKLLQENGAGEQAGFLIYKPIYSRDDRLNTVAERRKALVGYSYAPFRVGDLMGHILNQDDKVLAVELFDGDQPSANNLLFAQNVAALGREPQTRTLQHDKVFDVGQRRWTLRVRTLPTFWTSIDQRAPWVALVLGSMLSFGLFVILRVSADSLAQKEASERFALVIESAPAALMVVDAAGRIEMVNAPVEQLFGYDRSELLGRPVEMLMPARFAARHPELRHGFSGNGQLDLMGRGRDLYGLHKNGSEMALEIGLNSVRIDSGRIVLCSFLDVSERKAYEANLKKTKRDLEHSNQMAKIGGWEVDLRCQTVHWSAETCRIHEVPLDYKPTLEGAIEFYAPQARPLIQDAVQQAIATGTPWELELPFVTAKGRNIWVRAQGEAEFDQDGPVRLVGVFQDITERKLFTDELARRNQELDNFAYVASHDLKSPLRGVDQLATWLTEDLGENLEPTTREHLRLMRVRINRMEKLLDDLLAYSRASKIEGRSDDVDSRQLVLDNFDLVRSDKSFKLLLEGEFPQLITARAALDLVFRNLMGNAIKHHDAGQGCITVSVRPSGANWTFMVADDGPGIPPEHNERAFAMFQTLQPRDKVEGSGMGLAIVRKTIEVFGGQITLSANTPRGARFTFTWPGV